MSATSKIHYCIGSLNVGVAPRVQHFSAFHYIRVKFIKVVYLKKKFSIILLECI